jgi:hypothetical protein
MIILLSLGETMLAFLTESLLAVKSNIEVYVSIDWDQDSDASSHTVLTFFVGDNVGFLEGEFVGCNEIHLMRVCSE